MTTPDIYWLAGLLEGEGCFATCKARITVNMTDYDVVFRAWSLLGGNATFAPERTPVKSHHKQQWRAAVYGAQAAGWMMTLYPLMGARRQQKIRQTLLHWLRRPHTCTGKATREYRATYHRERRLRLLTHAI